MKKQIQDDTALYTIAWSQLYKFDKYSARKILPGLPGILSIYEKVDNKFVNLIFIACWRDGCRQCLIRFFDPTISKQLHIYEQIKDKEIYYKYTIIDSNPKDMQDILYWLINSYENKFNNAKSFNNSGRFKKISVDERIMGKDEIVEKIYPTHH